MEDKPSEERRLNIWINIGVNVVIPVIVLNRLSSEETLGPVGGLLLALAFPLTYGIVGLIREGRVSFFSGLGFASIILTGGISLLKLDPGWLAIKEASIPLLIAIALVVSQWLGLPLVEGLLGEMLNREKIELALAASEQQHAYTHHLNNVSYMIAGAFFLSAILNYVLARLIVVSPPGTAAYNAELGRLTALSYPVIALPSTAVLVLAVFILIVRLSRLTGLEPEDLIRTS